jgi:hypothetical protein
MIHAPKEQSPQRHGPPAVGYGETYRDPQPPAAGRRRPPPPPAAVMDPAPKTLVGS